jgi:RNA polymerase sigma-70 factor (ECF subfamily)
MNEPHPELTDEDIAKKICNGDKEAFGYLVDRYEAKLTRYIRKFTQEKENVTDLLQTIFTKAYTHINSFDQSRSFNSWIYRIAHNESVNHLKKNGNSMVSFIDFDTFLPHPHASESADKETIQREMKKITEKSLANISPKYREVLILYYYEELSYQEIADILKIPTSTVGVRIKRAKDAIEKELTSLHYTYDTP